MQRVLSWVTDAQPDQDSLAAPSHGPLSTMGTQEEEASRCQKQGRQGGLGNSTGEGARWLYHVCAGPKASDTDEGRGRGEPGGRKVDSVSGE